VNYIIYKMDSVIHYRPNGTKINRNIQTVPRLVIQDLKITDAKQMDLTQPYHNLNEPVSHTDNNSAIVIKSV
jgi:hypothetical protein